MLAWGNNSFGQLGDGTANNWRAKPWPFEGLSAKAIAIALGAEHTCVLQETGEVRCAGSGKYGQVGNTLPQTKAVAIPLSGPATQLASTWASTCASLTSGAIECWGSNSLGQLGNGAVDAVNPIVSPVTVKNMQSATALSAGLAHVCATKQSLVYCWGWNAFGQVGNGDAGTDRLSVSAPASVVALKQVTEVASGGRHNCALVSNGTDSRASVQCWGHNLEGQLGDGTKTDRALPVTVVGW
jgi:alpha-tubulin suppressor-like RCC1 family protein